MDVKNGDRFWQLEISGLQQFDGIFFCTQCIKHISNNHKLYQSSPNSSYDQKDVREKLHNCFFIERKTSKKSARPRFCEIQRLINLAAGVCGTLLESVRTTKRYSGDMSLEHAIHVPAVHLLLSTETDRSVWNCPNGTADA